MREEQKKAKEVANRLDTLVSYVVNSKVNMGMLRDSISDIRYAIARLR